MIRCITSLHAANDQKLTAFVHAQSIFKFLQNPRKPVILAMSRPDAKKNLTTLVKAFGEDETLKKLANLVLIMVSSQMRHAQSQQHHRSMYL